MQLGRWTLKAPGLLNHASNHLEKSFSSNLYVSQGDSDSRILCLAPGPISVSGRTCYCTSEFRLDLVSLSPARRAEEVLKMESFTRKMGMVKRIGY